MSFSFRVPDLVDATVRLGRDEITIPDVAEELPGDTETAAAAFRKSVRNGDFPATIARMLTLARAVARLETTPGGGTGFLVGPDRLLTNNHVFVGDDARTATAADATGTAVFNDNGDPSATASYALDPERLLVADHALDYALVGVDGRPGDEWGIVPVPGADVELEEGDDVFLIHHPGNGRKEIGLAGNDVVAVGETVVQYNTDTLRGSSGAPVFDWGWRLVALHHKGGELPNPSTGELHYVNEGILLRAFRDALDL